MSKQVNHYEVVPSKQYEDFDECLAAAARDCARRNHLALWQVSARWEDADREGIRLEWSE